MFTILLLFLSLYMIASAKDDERREERQYRISERRHQETLKALQKSKRKSSSPCTTHKVVRTVAKDKYGQTVAQEVTEYYGELCFDDNGNVYYD